MPVTRSRTYLTDIGLEDSNNTTGFLFGDEDSTPAEARTTPTAQVGNSDSFPSLFRQQAYPSMVSLHPPFGYSPAICLALPPHSLPSLFHFRYFKKFPVSAISVQVPETWGFLHPNFCSSRLALQFNFLVPYPPSPETVAFPTTQHLPFNIFNSHCSSSLN